MLSAAPLPAGWHDDVVRAAHDGPRAVEFAVRHGTSLPAPGGGETLRRWQLLAATAAVDLTVARVLEAHGDALAILAEAGADVDAPGGSWGVFAAGGPAQTARVAVAGADGGSGDAHGADRADGADRTDRANRADGADDSAATLDGTQPWCSLAGTLDHALVAAPAAHDPAVRLLVAVDLRGPGVHVDPPAGWVSRGLTEVPSGPVRFDHVPARVVGGPGWYLDRPGFARGGMGVAACWFGATAALAATVAARAPAGVLGDLHVGRADVAVHTAATTLQRAAVDVDAGTDDWTLAQRVRAVVAAAAEDVLTVAGHALGPAPLTFDDEHARRVADLTVYVRQHHAERDLAALGRLVRPAR